MHTPPTTLANWLTLLESRHAKAIDMGLDRVAQVKERLGIQFQCPVITVAGTNGKGSTCAMLESVLLQAGYRVGLYIKPHFLRFNERARIGGESVSDAVLIENFEAVEAQRGEISLSYFEFTTLAIMRLLAQAGLDAVILEVDWCRHRHRRSAPDRILDDPWPGRRKNMICLELPALHGVRLFSGFVAGLRGLVGPCHGQQECPGESPARTSA